ncbi:MAG: hypothetical protein ACRDD1_06150, partial [Planctomycetia bacterium]
SCLMRAPAGSPFAADCFAAAVSADPHTLRWGQIGPDLVAEMIDRHLLHDALVPPVMVCPVDWWSWRLLFAPGETLPSVTWAVHCWNEQWRRHGVDKNIVPTADTIYGRLLRRFRVDQEPAAASIDFDAPPPVAAPASSVVEALNPCPRCGRPEGVVWVHGHGQCGFCGQVVDDCCQGDSLG